MLDQGHAVAAKRARLLLHKAGSADIAVARMAAVTPTIRRYLFSAVSQHSQVPSICFLVARLSTTFSPRCRRRPSFRSARCASVTPERFALTGEPQQQSEQQ